MMTESWLAAAVAGAIIGALWFRRARRVKEDFTGIRQAVAQAAGGREITEPVFHDPIRFGDTMDNFMAIMRRHRRERDEFQREVADFRTILGSLDEGVMVVDWMHIIRFVNPAFASMLSIAAEPVGMTLVDALKDGTFEEIATAVMETRSAQERELSQNGDAPVRHLTVSAVLLSDLLGSPGVAFLLRDTTRLRQLEDVRTAFVANVSHELRTPLSIFQGYTETLIDNPELPPEDVRPMLEIMRKHSRRLNALVDDLLILARLESRDEQLHLAPLDVAKFLGEAVADWSLRSGEKKIALSAEVAPGLPAIFADAFRLEQVMGNLIENAIKYTNSGGSVTVRAAAADDGVEICVEDTGLGIPAADVPRIFERFYRADKGRSREHGGTGLGLSIVKHIVLAHGGSVRAESEHGRGTSVILRLPKNPPPIPGATPPAA